MKDSKRTVKLLLFIISIIIIIGGSLFFLVLNDEKAFSIDEDCIQSGGKWLEDFNECEYLSKERCLELGGLFNGCTSACRHSGADLCTMQCVPVCSFS